MMVARSRLATICALLAATVVAADDIAAVRSVADRFLADAAVPPNLRCGDVSSATGDEVEFVVQPIDGGQWLRGFVAIARSPLGLRRFAAPVPALVPPARVEPSVAALVVKDFVERWVPHATVAPWRMRVVGNPHRPIDPTQGAYDLTVVLHDGVTELPSFGSVSVCVWNGKVSSASFDLSALVAAQSPCVDEASAYQHLLVGLERSKVRLLRPLAKPYKIAACVRPSVRRAELCWLFPIEVRTDADAPSEVDALLDGATGGLLRLRPHHDPEQLRCDPAELLRHASAARPLRDEQPAWMMLSGSRPSIVFGSNRHRYGSPTYINPCPTVFVATLGDGSVSCVLQGCRRSSLRPRFSSPLMTYSVGTDGCVEACDLSNGKTRTLLTASRPGTNAALSPDGHLIAFVAARGGGDTDLFVGDLDADALQRQRRIERLVGAAGAPEFASDGRWVYFGRVSTRDAGAMIYRVRPDRWYDDGNPPPEKLADVPGVVGRLSAFPDNRRLLVWHSKGLDVLDVETRKLTPLGLPELHDPDLPEGKPLVVQEPAVSPDGQQIAFSAVRWSGKPEDPCGQYIYVCNLDGSGLKRITPLEDVVVPPYIFPATGKPAFEVPEEYAKPYAMP